VHTINIVKFRHPTHLWKQRESGIDAMILSDLSHEALLASGRLQVGGGEGVGEGPRIFGGRVRTADIVSLINVSLLVLRIPKSESCCRMRQRKLDSLATTVSE